MIIPEKAVVEPKFKAIAMIDDGLQPLCFAMIPEAEQDAVLRLLSDADVLEDLQSRGMDAEAVGSAPDVAFDSLTLPDFEHGFAYAKMSVVSDSAERMIGRRQTVRRIAASMRTDGCEVMELGPDDDRSDIARFDVVFIDYYLDDAETDGNRAELIAAEVQERRGTEQQQIVLMSSRENVRDLHTGFRRSARIAAASFAFVAKSDLDEDWKVSAHLGMLSRGMQHSSAIGEYISAVKRNAREAVEILATTIDDLDIGDLAYLQRIALHADGHPLGDYLSWLLSSHLAVLTFEGALRTEQAVVDGMEFEDGPLSPAEPSVLVASLYHDALFQRNLGALEGHPRALAGSELAKVPFVQLGDVFLTRDNSRAVVILSPDCDLAFSTVPKRTPDLNLGVIVLFGKPNTLGSAPEKGTDTSTDGMMAGTEVYRIDWRFPSFRTVRLGDLRTFLIDEGFDVTRRDRLRPVYSIKLQHELGNHLMRVGAPVMPPVAKHAKAAIHYREGSEVRTVTLEAREVVVSVFQKAASVRLTTSLVGKLKNAASNVHADLAEKLEAMPTTTKPEQKAKGEAARKVEALEEQIASPERWSKLLGDHPVPAPGECSRVAGSIYLAGAGAWTFPAQSAVVVFVIGDEAVTDGAEATRTDAEVVQRRVDPMPATGAGDLEDPVADPSGGPQAAPSDEEPVVGMKKKGR